MVEIRRLKADEVSSLLNDLGALLADCVNAGASVSFLIPFNQNDGEAYFRSILPQIENGGRLLLGAFSEARLVGSVQVVLSLPPNQPHRGEIAKLLVSPSARRQGIASLLMRAAEQEAGNRGKSLLVLDTVTGGAAEPLYGKLGWVRAGVIPRYALMPDGTPCSTTIFWKEILPPSP